MDLIVMKIVIGKIIDIIGVIFIKENLLFNKNWICIIINKNYMILKKKELIVILFLLFIKLLFLLVEWIVNVVF